MFFRNFSEFLLYSKVFPIIFAYDLYKKRKNFHAVPPWIYHKLSPLLGVDGENIIQIISGRTLERF